MILNILFGQFEVEAMPEALVCWDEYCDVGNPEAFQQLVLRTKTVHDWEKDSK